MYENSTQTPHRLFRIQIPGINYDCFRYINVFLIQIFIFDLEYQLGEINVHLQGRNFTDDKRFNIHSYKHLSGLGSVPFGSLDLLFVAVPFYMSRPHKATVDYFPHYVNHGKTMFTIESKFGNDGYAFWFKLLEILGNTEQHYINCNDIESWEFLLAKTHVNENIANEILTLCSKLNAIDAELWNMKIIRSDNFIENLDSVYKRREVNILNNSEIICLCKQKPTSSGITDGINPQSKVKESKVKESKVTAFDFLFLESEIALKSQFMRWYNFKANTKKPYKTQTGIEQAFKNLKKISCDNLLIATEIVDWSIGNEYQGLFLPPSQNRNGNKPETKSKTQKNIEMLAKIQNDIIQEYELRQHTEQEHIQIENE